MIVWDATSYSYNTWPDIAPPDHTGISRSLPRSLPFQIGDIVHHTYSAQLFTFHIEERCAITQDDTRPPIVANNEFGVPDDLSRKRPPQRDLIRRYGRNAISKEQFVPAAPLIGTDTAVRIKPCHSRAALLKSTSDPAASQR
jgi:hypothetical protein